MAETTIEQQALKALDSTVQKRKEGACSFSEHALNATIKSHKRIKE